MDDDVDARPQASTRLGRRDDPGIRQVSRDRREAPSVAVRAVRAVREVPQAQPLDQTITTRLASVRSNQAVDAAGAALAQLQQVVENLAADDPGRAGEEDVRALEAVEGRH